MIRIAVLLTAHNRKIKTLAALDALYGQVGLLTSTQTDVYLVDDGSIDHTSAAIAECFPQVRLLQGTGKLYWNGGMRLAFGEALKEGYDHYLWLNDDTTLFPSAVGKLLDAATRLGDRAIIVASTQDPNTGQLTYGGVRRLHRWRPLKFTMVAPVDNPVPVETMNGNCVLIPQAVAQKVGNLDPAFTHGLGDFDYGLRARKLGIEIYIVHGYCGYCQRNPLLDVKEFPLGERWKKIFSPHGLPPREWAVFAQRYAGPLWPIFWISPYLRKF
jgi:GT2 family glycosyltransferase